MNHQTRFPVPFPTRNRALRIRARLRKAMVLWRELKVDKVTAVVGAVADSSRDSAAVLRKDRICHLSKFLRTSNVRTVRPRNAIPGNHLLGQLSVLAGVCGRPTVRLSLTKTFYFSILSRFPVAQGQGLHWISQCTYLGVVSFCYDHATISDDSMRDS